MSDLFVGIAEDIEMAVLSFSAIAKKHQVTVHDVNLVWDELCRFYNEMDHSHSYDE